MKDSILEKRRYYHAPELTPYGRVEAITGTIVCTNMANKNGPDNDDVTPTVSVLVGDPNCF